MDRIRANYGAAVLFGTAAFLSFLLAVTSSLFLFQNFTFPGGSNAVMGNMPGERVSFSSVQANARSEINILLIGQDHEEGHRPRSDTMILCSLDTSSGTMTMTSFLRDLYVTIPGYEKNRINAAYAYGGAELLQETLAENFGVSTDGYIEVDFQQFARIIDILGGVTLELRQDEAKMINRSVPGSALSAGHHTLSGQQALAYARIRKLDADGDFSRTSRQRKVIGALIDAYRDAELSAIVPLMADTLAAVSTNMSKLKLLGYAVELFPKLSDIEIRSQSIPAEGTYQYQTIEGMSVLVADMEAARKQLQEALPGPKQ